MSFIVASIQEYLKKINSQLTVSDCLSIFVTTILVLIFWGYLFIQEKEERVPVSYIKGEEVETTSDTDGKPFASKNGETYTYSWCSGSGNISEKNKIFFNSEDEAINSGRRLSKLCSR